MTDTDRLYNLLPAVYRRRDSEQGRPLQALLRVIAEQVDLVEEDIEQLYENWFIETCEDWVVPYIGDLIGYRPIHTPGEPGDTLTARQRERTSILIPRREVANTIRYRRQKGTLALLELLARDVAGWPARAVELYKLLGWTQNLNHLRLDRGRTVDVRQGGALAHLGGPFDALAHTVDVRRITSHRTMGRYNIPSVGLFVWRLNIYPVTQTPAYCAEHIAPYCYTFSALGNDTPLYTRPAEQTAPTQIAGPLHLPIPISRRAFEERKSDYYGPDKSLYIWEQTRAQSDDAPPTVEPIAPDRIVVADLSQWYYRPHGDQVAVDPVLGRIVFPPGQAPSEGVLVSYQYAFLADRGGGEYDRPLAQPREHVLYRVGQQEQFATINEALNQWETDRTEQADAEAFQHAVIEITDSDVYTESISIVLTAEQSVQLRAAQRTRPIIRLLDWHTSRPDSLTVTMEPGARVTLDGLLVSGRGVRIRQKPPAQSSEDEGDEGEEERAAVSQEPVQISGVHLSHTTLVPGWTIGPDCEPRCPNEPSLELINIPVCVTVEHSIIGTIQVQQDTVKADPIDIRITDSVLDATSPEREALGAPGRPLAHAVLRVLRSTVFGRVQTHAIDLAENSIFCGIVRVARRQRGCMRFCYVTPGSRTPQRYRCQPDLVEKPIQARFARGKIAADERDRLIERERLRVRPQFNSTRYGKPAYGQLADTTADEIIRGADDESEMGVFHDLYQPQRAANLQTRLDEYTPAGTEAGIIYAS
jgi:hypothetical protein